MGSVVLNRAWKVRFWRAAWASVPIAVLMAAAAAVLIPPN
jgi:hypothetical protein